MDSSLIALIILSLLLGFACWMIFMWAVQVGEFNDVEGPKHRMLEEEDEAIVSPSSRSKCEGLEQPMVKQNNLKDRD